jgi:UDP-GlcNAc:undecaprenyl-phosphate/decaprenyl-phosphate GlcNAc-1-phosphate transferase
MQISLIPIYILVFIFSYLGIFLVRIIVSKKNWTTKPRDDRWSGRVVGMHGGIGFVPITLIGILVVYVNQYSGHDKVSGLIAIISEHQHILGLMTGAIIMFFLGWADDVLNLKPGIKLIFQFIAASLVVFTDGGFQLTDFVLLNALTSFLWLIGITNAVNMSDNMDGLSVGIVVIGTLTAVGLLISFNPTENEPIVVSIGIVFACALMSFWFHNRQPAKIFMGDSGSLAIGFILASILIPSSSNIFFGIHNKNYLLEGLLQLIAPATILAVPIFDTTLVTITRKWRSQRASVGGQDHISHRLVSMGFSEKFAVHMLHIIAIVGGAVTWVLLKDIGKGALIWFLYFIFLIMLGVYLAHVRVKYTANDLQENWLKKMVGSLLNKWKLAEIILDLLIITVCSYMVFLFSNGMMHNFQAEIIYVKLLTLIIFTHFLSFYIFGVYKNNWRLLFFIDSIIYLKAAGVAAFLNYAISMVFLNNLVRHNSSMFIVLFVLVFFFTSCVRYSFEWLDKLSSFLKKNRV